jgi:hypothetical protein
VYLTYLDESDTRNKGGKWRVLAAALVKDCDFDAFELLSSIVIEDLMPSDALKRFDEFHACELYGGYGVFEGIDQLVRFDGIRRILDLVSSLPVAIVYGAVNAQLLEQQIYGSADPLDVAFRMCAEGVQSWLADQRSESIQRYFQASDDLLKQTLVEPTLALFIADDCDPKSKAVLQKSFRALRKRIRPPEYNAGKLTHVHDDMYFGDSRYSVGIQLADLCSYFVARHLDADSDPGVQGFYSMIEKQIVRAKQAPDEVRSPSQVAF